MDASESDGFELRLFLEEICSNICRFHHVRDDHLRPQQIRIDQEVYLGLPGSFADIRVQAAGIAPYFVEVKYGYSPDRVLHTLARKYGSGSAAQADAARVVVVYDMQRAANRHDFPAQLQAVLRSGLTLSNEWQRQIDREQTAFRRAHRHGAGRSASHVPSAL